MGMRVYALVWESWQASDLETQRELLAYIGSQPATVAAFDFLLKVAESCSGDERYFGHVAGAMVRLIRIAYGPKTGGYAGEHVLDLERTLPAWAAPSEEDVVRLLRRYDLNTFAALLTPRLQALSATESYPRVLAEVLGEIGADDLAFADAVCRSARASGLDTHSGSERRANRATLPAWRRPDALLEWGILTCRSNPAATARDSVRRRHSCHCPRSASPTDRRLAGSSRSFRPEMNGREPESSRDCHEERQRRA